MQYGQKRLLEGGEKIIMINEDKVCCMCGEHKKFLARINAGKKYYCISCQGKITKSGMDYWKPCSMQEFFGNILSDKKKPYSLKEHLRQIKEEYSKKEEPKSSKTTTSKENLK